MKKRLLSLVLCLVMVFSLLPSFAMAADNDAAKALAEDKPITNFGWSNESDGLRTNKELTYDAATDTYTIKMEAFSTGEVISQTVEYGVPLDIAVVIDQSGSMISGTEMTSSNKTWTYSNYPTDQELFYKVGDNYYPVNRTYSVSGDDRIYFLYYTTDDGDYYLRSSTSLYYNSSLGGYEYHFDGTLYVTTGKPRYEALKESVTQFCQTIAKKSQEANVEHKIALIGFAGNEVPGTSSSNGVYHWTGGNNTEVSDGDNRSYDYVNTGLFIGDQFKNYRTITEYRRVGDNERLYSNVHYFVLQSDGTYRPVIYSTTRTSSTRIWHYLGSDTKVERSSSQPFYRAVYSPLTAQDYQAALVSAYKKDGEGNPMMQDGAAQLNPSLDASIDLFGCYGGTYVSYGMAMANQVFANNTEQRPDSNGDLVTPKKVIIVFTDGVPGGSGYDAGVAGEALADAAYAKDTYGAQVYTIGMYSSEPADGSLTANFMNSLSSNEFARLTEVFWEDLQPSKTYYYNNGNKTYAVSCDGDFYIIADWNDGGVSHYTVTEEDNYWSTDYYIIGDPDGDYSYLYDIRGNKIPSSDTLTRGTYHATFATDSYGNHYPSTSGSSYEVSYDYYWTNTDGYVCFARKQGETTHNQFLTLETHPSGDTTQYCFTAKNAAELTEHFNTIATSIEHPTSYATLDSENSLLRDVLTDEFSKTNATTVKVETVEGTYVPNAFPSFAATGTDVTNDPGYTVEWSGPDGKTLTVKGFDFSKNFIGPPSHNGQKLVVTVTGLKLAEDALGDAENRVFSNTNDSGIVKLVDENETLYQPFQNPYLKINTGKESYVIDFNAPMKLAEGVTKDKYITRENASNGVFDRDGSFATYQLSTDVLNGTKYAGDQSTDLKLTHGADTAMIYGKFYKTSWQANAQTGMLESTTTTDAKASWKRVTVVPAASVYFDDDFEDAITVGDGSGYNRDVTVSTATKRVDNKTTMVYKFFTFTGTGIDVYCTTKGNGGYVQATLYSDPNGIGPDAAEYANKVPGTETIAVRNYSEEDRFNVPSVSFVGQEFNTYTLMISAPANVNYYIDGVRVYNPMGKDEASQNVYADTPSEANALFVNLHDQLVNSKTDFTVTNNLPAQGSSDAANGVLFMDDVYKLSDETFDTPFAAYQEQSPNNEIYLATNQAITFQLNKQNGYQYWIGLSAPDAASNSSGSVSVNSTTANVSIGSPVDMYYPITDLIGTEGSVTITNRGSAMVSVTNIKVTHPGDTQSGEAKALFAPLTTRSLKLAANNGVDPDAVVTPDPTPTPSIQDMIRQMISDFVSSVFGSISRIFGH